MSDSRGALAGMRVLVTRTEAQAETLVRELVSLDAEVRTLPLIEIAPPSSWEPADRAIAGLDRYHAAVFTSVNAVARFWERLQDRVGACDVPALPRGVRVLAVGPKTAAALRQRGVDVDGIPEEHRAAALEGELARIAGRDGIAGMRVLLPRAEKGSDALPSRVRAAGGEIDVVPVYRTVMPGDAAAALQSLLRDWRPDVIALASGSAAEHLVTALGGGPAAQEALRGIRLAAIGPVTAERIRALGLGEPLVARRPDAAELASALGQVSPEDS